MNKRTTTISNSYLTLDAWRALIRIQGDSLFTQEDGTHQCDPIVD